VHSVTRVWPVHALQWGGSMPRLRLVLALLAAIVVVSGPASQAAQMTAPSVAKSQAELEELAARLPITLDTKGAFPPLTVDPYADRDPVEVWNDWRMENKKDREPPLLVVAAHNMWAYLHGLATDGEDAVACQPAGLVKAPYTSESLFTAVINIAPGEPVPGEEAETVISADPNNPQHIVASANHRLLYDDTCSSSLSTSGVTLDSNGGQELYWSTDGGATWSRQCAPWDPIGSAYTLTTSNGTSPFTFQSSDPSISWDTYGNAYVFTLPWWQDASGSYSGNAVNVVKWDVSTNTWSAIATVQSTLSCSSTTCDTIDKTEGTIDATSGQAYSHTDRMYVAWTRIFYNLGWRYRLRIAYADPPYNSWTVANFAPGGTVETGVGVTRLASSFAVAADGTLYLAWDRNLSTGSSQRISKSTDGGATWSTAVQMSSTSVLTDFASSTKIAAQDTRGIALLPQLSVDACATSPYKGYLYMAYTDYHSGVTSGNDVDAYVRRSTDGGATWTTVATFTGVVSGTSQFLPTTTVDQSTGTVTAAWYDTSVDPTLNRKTQVYVSQSADGGTTWSAQELMTDSGEEFSHHDNYLDENSTDMPNVTTLHHYQYGEYMGATSAGGKLWVGWTDSRNWLTETPSDTEYEDFGIGYPCTPPAAPVASASVPQDNRIDIGWNDSPDASILQYLLYRSTTAGGPYTQIATVADTSPGVGNGPSYIHHDDTVSGGIRYYYVVVATDGACPSPYSNEVDGLATGACLLPPTFAGLASVTNPGNSTCTLSLAWNAGASNCSGALTYNVYRSTTSGFTPSAGNRIATAVAGTSYTDAVDIAHGTDYYYVVRAVDDSNSVEDSNTVQKSGSPTGPITSSSATDTFEGSLSGGGFDLPGWVHGAVSGSTDWAWSTTYYHDGTHSWFAADVAGPDDKILVSPSFGVLAATTLSFWHTYAFEGTTSTCYDAGTLEYTTDAGSSWTVVPQADFTAGGYTGTAGSSYSNPIGGDRAWCGGTAGTMTQVSLNLGGDANLLNKTVRLRWHEGDDSSLGATGWYVDTVAVNNYGTAATCTPGTGCTAPGAPLLVGAVGDCGGVTLTWTAGTGSTSSYNVYRGTTSGGPYTKLGGMPVTATTYTDTTGVAGTPYYYVVTGACDAGGATESVYSNELSAAKNANGAACDDGNACTTNDACSNGACVGGAALVCNDGNPCTNDTCNPATGCAFFPIDGNPCDDGNACTTSDTCSNGSCVGGPAVVCNDGNVCTDDSCNPTAGCVYANNTAPCDDGNACTATDVCQAGACVGTNPVTCTALDPCHDVGVCNPGTGLCSNPIKPNGTECDDGDLCTQTDVCQNGVCVGFDPVTCPILGQCYDQGTCNPQTGYCSFPQKPNGSTCNDGNLCTTNDSCQNGACTGGPALVCNDGNACTSDSCNPATGCVHTNLPNGSACDDGNACTTNNQCQNGTCDDGEYDTCNDGNACTSDSCNPATGCVHTNLPNGSACDDGNPCTTSDTCNAGACGGTPVGPPSEIGNSVRLNGGGGGGGGGATTISWTDAPGPYNVYRGLISGSWSYNHTCFDADVPGPSADAAVPTVGRFYFYLVSRRDDVCHLESVLGHGPGGAADPNPSPCP
jgi:fibronectin type 3 domain-containing protein